MNGRRLLLTIGVVGFVIIASIAIFSIDWGGSDSTLEEAVRPVNIADYSNTNVQVRMTMRGPINDNQEHEDLQITVGRDSTVGELLNGYQGSVTRSETIANNSVSYKAFLSALHNAGFTKRQIAPRGIQYDGACPVNVRYTFEFIGGGEDAPKSTWATNCGKKVGTFAGDLVLVKKLFRAQIPKEQYKSLTADSQY